MLDFAIAMNSYARVKIEEFTNIIDHRTNAHKRRLEVLKGKSQIAIDMITRAGKKWYICRLSTCGYWYSKPVFIETMNETWVASYFKNGKQMIGYGIYRREKRPLMEFITN